MQTNLNLNREFVAQYVWTKSFREIDDSVKGNDAKSVKRSCAHTTGYRFEDSASDGMVKYDEGGVRYPLKRFCFSSMDKRGIENGI